ncbi:metal-sensitive transcriptional regulator [Candidatus Saccharibacteria bacterium]|nr:metal-sensitive transcriptional regulator [Candidatus Saccharibacteria bacterium]MBI3337698.1 metal-sensitive transcriptional regulator [Candidatus Saccharibacteria bacterium]
MISTLKKKAIHRSRIIQGQLKGLEKMIEKEEYCMDIMIQSLAIQKSLSSLDKLILENHLRTHVKESFGSNSETNKEQVVEELLKLYKLSNIRSQ